MPMWILFWCSHQSTHMKSRITRYSHSTLTRCYRHVAIVNLDVFVVLKPASAYEYSRHSLLTLSLTSCCHHAVVVIIVFNVVMMFESASAYWESRYSQITPRTNRLLSSRSRCWCGCWRGIQVSQRIWIFMSLATHSPHLQAVVITQSKSMLLWFSF